MIPKISKKAEKFRKSISPVREIMSFADPAYLKKMGVDASKLISFAGGWVNHESPVGLKNSYMKIVSDKDLFHKSGAYPPTLGTNDAKNAVIKFEENLYNVTNLNPSQIVIGHSSTQLAANLFEVLLDPDDSILLLDPSYCNYPTQILTSFHEIELLRFPVIDKETWTYNADSKAEEFGKFILENKPKVVLLIVPDNPTSKILSNEFVKTALDAVSEIGSYLIIDFAYKEIVFNDEVPEYFSWAPNDNLISLHSNSKWARSLGRRMGWIEAPEYVATAIESIMNSSILCPDMLHQMAFVDYVNTAVQNNSLRDYVKSISLQYKLAAEQTVKSVEKYLDFKYIIPDGGLYLAVQVNSNSAQFVETMLKNTGVLFVPGWGFGRTVAEAIRISYGPMVCNLDKIDEGIKRVGEYLNK